MIVGRGDDNEIALFIFAVVEYGASEEEMDEDTEEFVASGNIAALIAALVSTEVKYGNNDEAIDEVTDAVVDSGCIAADIAAVIFVVFEYDAREEEIDEDIDAVVASGDIAALMAAFIATVFEKGTSWLVIALFITAVFEYCVNWKNILFDVTYGSKADEIAVFIDDVVLYGTRAVDIELLTTCCVTPLPPELGGMLLIAVEIAKSIWIVFEYNANLLSTLLVEARGWIAFVTNVSSILLLSMVLVKITELINIPYYFYFKVSSLSFNTRALLSLYTALVEDIGCCRFITVFLFFLAISSPLPVGGRLFVTGFIFFICGSLSVVEKAGMTVTAFDLFRWTGSVGAASSSSVAAKDDAVALPLPWFS